MMKRFIYLILFLALPMLLFSQSNNIIGKNLKINQKSKLKQDVTIGSSSFDASAILTVSSTTQGALMPRMSTVQRDAISTPTDGLLIFNTTTSLYEFFETTWQSVGNSHDLVTLSGVPDYITLSGQDIVRGLVDLGTDITGTTTATSISDFDTEVSNNVSVTANTAKITNSNHTGDVTGATVLTIGAKKVTVAMLADGVDGELITWDALGGAATVAVGTSGQILTSNGVGAAPTFQAVSGDGDGIYSGSGSLTGATTVTMGPNPLTFSGNLTTFQGIDATSSNFSLEAIDNVGTKLFRVRNDGDVFIPIGNVRIGASGVDNTGPIFTEPVTQFGNSSGLGSIYVGAGTGTTPKIGMFTTSTIGFFGTFTNHPIHIRSNNIVVGKISTGGQLRWGDDLGTIHTTEKIEYDGRLALVLTSDPSATADVTKIYTNDHGGAGTATFHILNEEGNTFKFIPDAGYVDPTGVSDKSTFATSTVTTQDLAEFVKAMYEGLKAQGLIKN